MKKISLPLDPNMSSSSPTSSMSNDPSDNWYNNLEPVFSIHWIWTAIALSFTTFSLFNHLLFRLQWWLTYFRYRTGSGKKSDDPNPDPDHQLSPLAKLRQASTGQQQEPYEDWKWRNIWVSLVHSMLSGSIALYLSYDYFWSRKSLLGVTNSRADSADTYRLAICFSIGYFLYDTLLSVSKLGTYPDRLEIIVHHTITTATLIWVIVPGWKQWQQFQIYCIFGLIIELSNVFIHIRSLENIRRTSRSKTRTTTGSTTTSSTGSTLSTLNSLCAIVSIFLFRFYPLARIWLDLYKNRSNTAWLLPLASLPMLSFTLISIVILWRLVREDFLNKPNIDRPSPQRRKRQQLSTYKPETQFSSTTEIDPLPTTLTTATATAYSPTDDVDDDDDLRCDLCVKKHQ